MPKTKDESEIYDQMLAMLYQNGQIEMYTLKPVTKQDVATILEADNVDK